MKNITYFLLRNYYLLFKPRHLCETNIQSFELGKTISVQFTLDPKDYTITYVGEGLWFSKDKISPIKFETIKITLV